MNDAPEKTFSARRTAFTLIELLVVISIIALLMAVLMPALQHARKQASGSACLANVKSIATAWFMYQLDSDGWTSVSQSLDKGRNVQDPAPSLESSPSPSRSTGILRESTRRVPPHA